jgi:hypothetical protein
MPNQSVEDAFTLSDSVRFSTFGLGLTLSDNFNLSDSVRTSRTQNTPLSDTISISDTLSAVLNLALGFSDAIYIFDALSVTGGTTNLLITNLRSDTFYLSDSICYAISNSLIVLSDNILFSDKIKVILNSAGNSYLRRYLNDVIN